MREVPTGWAPRCHDDRVMIRRLVQLYLGLGGFGIGLAMLVRAELGVAPWDVLTLGLQRQTQLSFGWITILVGILVLIGWIPLRQRPGLGTVSNAVFIGLFADVGLGWIVPTDNLIVRWVFLLGGVLLIGISSGLYIGARFGAGPRDGLMTGIVAQTGWPIWLVRGLIEVSVLVAGWLLGGTVGIGTLVFALGIGPICNVTIPLFTVPLPAQSEREAKAEGSAVPSSPEGDTPAY